MFLLANGAETRAIIFLAHSTEALERHSGNGCRRLPVAVLQLGGASRATLRGTRHQAACAIAVNGGRPRCSAAIVHKTAVSRTRTAPHSQAISSMKVEARGAAAFSKEYINRQQRICSEICSLAFSFTRRPSHTQACWTHGGNFV